MKLNKILTRRVLAPLGMIMKGDVFLRSLTSNSILNIMYHGVVKEDSTFFSPRHIQVDQFERQLKYLKKEFDILTLDEAFEYKRNGAVSKNKAVTITFDDGYLNNLDVALPVLEDNKINATFFISSICLEDENYILWSDIIEALNYFYKNEVIEFENDKFLNSQSLTNKQRTIFNYIKLMNPKQRDDSLQRLVEKYDLRDKIESLPDEIWRLMNKKELIELSRSTFVTIASHGHLHYNLANISKEDAKNELTKSKLLLESHLNLNVKAIAYPDGSYDDNIKDLATSVGYLQQLAVNYKMQGDKTDDRILNRHGISSTTTFEANILLLNKAFKNKGF